MAALSAAARKRAELQAAAKLELERRRRDAAWRADPWQWLCDAIQVGTSLGNIQHRAFADAQRRPNIAVGFATLHTLADSIGQGGCQFGGVVPRPSWESWAKLCAAFSHHIARVVLRRPYRQVSRIDATGIIASVQNKKARWNDSLCPPPRVPMGTNQSPRSFRPQATSENAITRGIASAGPHPTLPWI